MNMCNVLIDRQLYVVLYAMGYPLFCEKHHFGLRNGLYWRPKEALLHHKEPLSECEMGSFTTRVSEIRGAERME